MRPMPGSALVTFDCEGLWGMADHLRPADREAITTESLTHAYGDILSIFDRHGLPATFAFVSLFASPPEVVADHLEELESSPAMRVWAAAPVADLRAGRTSGWEGHSVFRRVVDDGRHEVASHGWSHLPWTYPEVTPADLAREVAGVAAWREREQVDVTTWVYPRNQVAAPDLLLDGGIVAYRQRPALRTGGVAGRALNVLEEFRPASADPQPVPGHPVALPPGVPINWRSGPRKVVPAAASRRRMAAMLDDAVRTDGVAHLWLHPHNLLTGAGQVELLDALCADIAVRRDRDGLEVLTQRDLAARVGV